jgi:hypothetical protein
MNVPLSTLTLVLVTAIACGGGTPTPTNPSPAPTPTPTPTPTPPVVVNTPPTIGTFTIQSTRTNEPPNFADLSEDVPVAVTVTDAESPISDLTFNWSSSVGTLTGTGVNVTWKAPAQATTPATVTLTLEVVETYSSAGKTETNRVSKTATISLHDSAKEVGDMARQFLLDFSDSNIQDVGYIMRNFQQGCYGTADETSQVANNRVLFRIIASNVGPAPTTVKFGGICPYRNLAGDACSQVSVYWKSLFLKNDGGNKAGDLTEATGTDQLAAMYYKDQQRWKLCDSAFDGNHTLKAIPRYLVP